MERIANGMANADVAIALPMARTDGRTNERVSHLPETSSVSDRAREIDRVVPYPDREYTEFLDRVRDRARKSHRVIERNRWVEPIALTIQKTYDQETEQQLASIHDNERRTA